MSATDQAEQVRIRLDLAYDGTEFYGWAEQPDVRTVEGEVAHALRVILRGAASKLVVGGRTDTGVHARGSVAHFDVSDAAMQTLRNRGSWTAEQAARQRLKGVLPDDILVREVSRAPEGFDARFSPLHRRYEYRIADHVAARDPLRRRDTVHYDLPLDVDAMDEAAQCLIGLNDFAAFCKRREGATTVRTLLNYRWRRDAHGVLIADVQADAFCHSMVRALVGAIVRVGEGKFTTATVQEILQARQRDSRMVVMPAHGLSLEEIVYPPDEQLGQRADEARAMRSLPQD